MISQEKNSKELGVWSVTANLGETLGNISERDPEFPKFSWSLAQGTS